MGKLRITGLLAAGISLFAFPATADDAWQSDDGCLDADALELTFAEEFEALDVSAWGPGTRWIAHTPWAGDFGDARFADPTDGFPFQVEEGILRIEARKSEDGVWRSGLLASVDTNFEGFAQQFGYFEIRTSLPTGPGVWPAFWLIGVDRSRYTAEIDVLEYYGAKPEGYSSVVHVWHREDEPYTVGTRNEVFDDQIRADAFNQYGVMVAPDWITFYFNGCPYWQTETPVEHHQPMFVLLNLALGSGFPIDETPNPSHMFVDYVRVYALPDAD